MRKRLYEVIEVADEKDNLSKFYDVFMMIVIVCSLVPIATKGVGFFSPIIDHVTVVIFIIDYLLRLATADLKLKKGAKSFWLYLITPMAIIDLLSILPSIIAVSEALRILKVLRLLRTLKVFRVFKAGKIITMCSTLFGIAIVALPAGIVTAGYMDELNKIRKEKVDKDGPEV